MADMNITDMHQMQRRLWEKNKESWPPMQPHQARNTLLWMVGEIGEVSQIIKKRGEEDIMQDPALRAEFLTELTDVLMYFNNVCICYGFTPEEISEAYRQKHNTNMNRDFYDERKKYLKK